MMMKLFTLFFIPTTSASSSSRSLRKSKSTNPLDLLEACERAVWTCCQTDGRADDFLPIKCFEDNGCKGLQWIPKKVGGACAPRLVSAAGAQLLKIKKKLENDEDSPRR
jgi:hypothetical protein